VSPVRYELGFYIPENDILHSLRRDNLIYHILSVHPQSQKPLDASILHFSAYTTAQLTARSNQSRILQNYNKSYDKESDANT
jgi:hypothetical protein